MTNNANLNTLPIFLNASQVKEILQISQSTFLRKIKDGSLPIVRVGRRLLIPKEFIENLILKSYENLTCNKANIISNNQIFQEENFMNKNNKEFTNV
ncbi:MAG: helix-turn-helix domain-containing protein [Treponema sp.]|nr:helix-turn-helix domain-containing protein [Treponema sp.]